VTDGVFVFLSVSWVRIGAFFHNTFFLSYFFSGQHLGSTIFVLCTIPTSSVLGFTFFFWGFFFFFSFSCALTSTGWFFAKAVVWGCGLWVVKIVIFSIPYSSIYSMLVRLKVRAFGWGMEFTGWLLMPFRLVFVHSCWWADSLYN
jgi:hypothetical protein